MPSEKFDQPTDEAGTILERHRPSLRRVVRVRLDDRLIRRLDPSDVVQDVFAEALREVHRWIREEKSVYACLYQLTRERLAKIHRDHLRREKRSVKREEPPMELPDGSVADLAERL